MVKGAVSGIGMHGMADGGVGGNGMHGMANGEVGGVGRNGRGVGGMGNRGVGAYIVVSVQEILEPLAQDGHAQLEIQLVHVNDFDFLWATEDTFRHGEPWHVVAAYYCRPGA